MVPEKRHKSNSTRAKKNGNTIECMLCVFGLTIFANIWFNLKTQQAGKNIFLNIYLLNFCTFSKKRKKNSIAKT